MNAAPAHLEAKLRFWEFSVAQLAAVFAGLLLGLAWGSSCARCGGCGRR